MAARAIWKGVVHIGTLTVPVKLFSAVKEQTIHFRLLHKADHQPVKQQFVGSEDEDVVDFAEVRKAFPVTRGRMVMLEAEELEKIEPKESRDVTVERFVSPSEIDHRWYKRAYYLGPDGSVSAYFAAAAALEKTKKVGIARWVMRDRDYVGALRAENGYLMLIVLRHAEEVIAADALEAPEGRELASREIEMAGQLLEALHGEFDPSEFEDQYRARVLDLVETKAAGKKPKVRAFRPRPQKGDNLADVLAASLAKEKRSARG